MPEISDKSLRAGRSLMSYIFEHETQDFKDYYGEVTKKAEVDQAVSRVDAIAENDWDSEDDRNEALDDLAVLSDHIYGDAVVILRDLREKDLLYYFNLLSKALI
jgi:hypothetical protein